MQEAFAVVREASKRVLGLRPFDVQLIGKTAMHNYPLPLLPFQVQLIGKHLLIYNPVFACLEPFLSVECSMLSPMVRRASL